MPEKNQPAEYQEAMKSISPGRIALAILLGLGIVVYMFVKEFKWSEFAKIEWTSQVYFWLGMAVIFSITRHLSYMARLRHVTNGFFSWKKCFELIMVWEFSSAVTPTSVGGSAVALFALSQDKLPAGRTTMIVMYTVILDTLFFLSSILILFLAFGALMVQPGANDLTALISQTVYGKIFFFAYLFMLCYGGLFFYGVFISPQPVKKLLFWFTGFSLLKRFRSGAEKMADEMYVTSSELKNKKFTFHLLSFICTFGAWSSKFLILICLILGFVSHSTDPLVLNHYNDFMQSTMDWNAGIQQIFIFARQLSMWIITAITPTPGGSGVAESAFMIFHKDYIPSDGTLLLILTVFWRSFTYYLYLFLGMIVVPNWLRRTAKKTP